MTASQPHVISRPLHVRCSSQPMGLVSSLRFIQRRKNEIHTTGVQKVRCSHTCCRDGGGSRQMRRVFAPAKRIASASANNEMVNMSAASQASCPLVTVRKTNVPKLCDKFVINPIPTTNTKSLFAGSISNNAAVGELQNDALPERRMDAKP